MELRKKTSWVVIAAATAIFGTVSWFSYRAQVAYIDRYRVETLKDIASEVSASLAGSAGGAATYAQIVATLPTVRAAMAQKDRLRLADELGHSYRLARSKYNAQTATFQTPDLKVFCRVIRPDLFGDSVSHRPIMVKANRDKKAQSGLETSVTNVGVRGVVPVMSPEGEHVGSFEWGFLLTRIFQRLKESSNADSALLVDEATFTAPITSKGAAAKAAAAAAAEPDRIQDGYRTVESTNVTLLRDVVTKDLLSAKEAITRFQMVGDTEYGVVSVPIFDFGARRLGSIVIAKSMAEPQRAIRTTRLTFLAAVIAGLILVAGVVQVVFNGLIIRPLLEIGENADAMTKDPGIKIDLKARDDEIGAMAKDMEFLRARLAHEKEEADRAENVSARVKRIEKEGA